LGYGSRHYTVNDEDISNIDHLISEIMGGVYIPSDTTVEREFLRRFRGLRVGG